MIPDYLVAAQEAVAREAVKRPARPTTTRLTAMEGGMPDASEVGTVLNLLAARHVAAHVVRGHDGATWLQLRGDLDLATVEAVSRVTHGLVERLLARQVEAEVADGSTARNWRRPSKAFGVGRA